jgi:hypothetical protein
MGGYNAGWRVQLWCSDMQLYAPVWRSVQLCQLCAQRTSAAWMGMYHTSPVLAGNMIAVSAAAALLEVIGGLSALSQPWP